MLLICPKYFNYSIQFKCQCPKKPAKMCGTLIWGQIRGIKVNKRKYEKYIFPHEHRISMNA
jgi:hypothetical protein